MRRSALNQGRQLLAALASGRSVSGAVLAERAGLTRAAIWKQVESLRARGLPIESRGAAGYCLPWPLEPLDESAIRSGLDAPLTARLGALEVHWELDSTSTELQRRGPAVADLSFVLAESQSAGRGRRGRGWLSPPGLNLYLSCLKRFDAGFAALSGLSLAVGVMVVRALDRLGIAGAALKWPNDVMTADGKLAGVLVELSGEFQGPCAAVVGVGLNLRLTEQVRERASQPVCDLATLAVGQPPGRNLVAATLIGTLAEGLRQFERDGFSAFAADFARYDWLRGQPLRAMSPRGEWLGVGAGVDAHGALQLRLADGSVRRLDSADVSIRRA